MKFAAYFGLVVGMIVWSSAFSANPFGSLKAPVVPTEALEVIRKPDPEKPPLQRWPVQNYILMGILTAVTAEIGSSQSHRIAILRTPAPHSQTFLLRFGDVLGDRDGYINGFDVLGLTIVQRSEDDAPEAVRLRVRNRGVKQFND